MEFKIIIRDAIFHFLKNYGRTKVVIGYLVVVSALLASTAWNFDWDMQDGGKFHFAFIPTSISVLSLIFLVIFTIPVWQYLKWTKNCEQFINKNDVMEEYYIPFFEKAFHSLDLENYSTWTSDIAIQGTLLITNKQYDNLHIVQDMMNRAVRHNEQELLDGLIKNLGLVIEDLLYVMDSHLVMRSDDKLTFKRFYKELYPNPHYNEDLDRYMKIVRLISDLTFEMTRILNLILDTIRKYKSGFMVEVGSLSIAECRTKILKYRKDEISASPYPGLQKFLKIRLSRDSYMDTCTDLDLQNL